MKSVSDYTTEALDAAELEARLEECRREERKACALVAKDMYPNTFSHGHVTIGQDIAKAIRQRGDS